MVFLKYLIKNEGVISLVGGGADIGHHHLVHERSEAQLEVLGNGAHILRWKTNTTQSCQTAHVTE